MKPNPDEDRMTIADRRTPCFDIPRFDGILYQINRTTQNLAMPDNSIQPDGSEADVARSTFPPRWYDNPHERVWCQAWGTWLPKQYARTRPPTYTKPGESAVICNSPHKAADFLPSLEHSPKLPFTEKDLQ